MGGFCVSHRPGIPIDFVHVVITWHSADADIFSFHHSVQLAMGWNIMWQKYACKCTFVARVFLITWVHYPTLPLRFWNRFTMAWLVAIWLMVLEINGPNNIVIGGTDCDSGRIDFNWRGTRPPKLCNKRARFWGSWGMSDTLDKAWSHLIPIWGLYFLYTQGNEIHTS